MRSLSFLGLRVMTEKAWTSTMLERAALQHEGDALRTELAKLIAQGQSFAEKARAAQGEAETQVRTAIETVLGCNVQLAHRAEVAELMAERLRAQLTEVLRKP